MSFEALLAQARAEARRRHPKWDAARFEAHVEVARALDAPAPVVEAYLALLADGAARPPSALRDLLFGTTFRAATSVAPLARLHNVAEGLARELPWLDGFLAHELAEAPLERLEDELVATLEAVFATSFEARPWGPGSTCVMRSLRSIDEDVLPGSLELVAPRVVRVRDRDDPKRGAGLVVLGPNRVHPTPLPDGDAIAGASLAGHIGDQQIVVDGRRIFATGLRVPRASIASSAPFVAAIAEDSQHVWIASPR